MPSEDGGGRLKDWRPWGVQNQAGPVPRRKSRIPARIPAAAVVAAIFLAFGLWWHSTQPLQSAGPALGLFVGGESPSAVASVASRLRVTPKVMSVYAYGPKYTAFSDPPDTSLRLILGVGAVTPEEARTIGDTLVASGHANTIIRIMWEMNGNWLPWGTQAMTARRYIAMYRAAQRAFAAVPRNRFEYVWDVNAGTAEPGRTEFDTYPGDAYVTNIGFDFYDYNRAIGFGAPESAVPPLLAFAAAHHRPTSIDEWGLDGLDDPAYVDFVARVAHNPANHVTLQVYFYAGNSKLTQFPLAEKAYINDFSADP